MCFVSPFTSDRLLREKDARPLPPSCLGEYKTRLDFYNPILVDISSSSCFQGGVFPKEETKREVMECVLSLVLQINPHGIESISPCFQTKLEEHIPERRDKSTMWETLRVGTFHLLREKMLQFFLILV